VKAKQKSKSGEKCEKDSILASQYERKKMGPNNPRMSVQEDMNREGTKTTRKEESRKVQN